MSKLRRIHGNDFMRVETLSDCVELVNENSMRTWRHLKKLYRTTKLHDHQLRFMGAAMLVGVFLVLVDRAEKDELRSTIENQQEQINNLRKNVVANTEDILFLLKKEKANQETEEDA